MRALLREAGFINDEDGVGITQAGHRLVGLLGHAVLAKARTPGARRDRTSHAHPAPHGSQ